MAEFVIDDIDRKIIKLLVKNSKSGNKEIAEKVGLTITPTYERIKRLEREGIIESYTVKLNKKRTGKGLLVFCMVSLKEHNADLIKEFENDVVHLKEVSSCHHIAGDYDYLLQIEVNDIEEYQKFLKKKLASIPNIANVRSSFAMSTLK